MKRRNASTLIAVLIAAMVALSHTAQSQDIPNWRIDPDKELKPNTKWLDKTR